MTPLRMLGRVRARPGVRRPAAVRRSCLLIIGAIALIGCSDADRVETDPDPEPAAEAVSEAAEADTGSADEQSSEEQVDAEQEEADDAEADEVLTTPAHLGATCLDDGEQETTDAGLEVRCEDIRGDQQWWPVPDEVAVSAHEALKEWLADRPDDGPEIPIERHDDVPAEYEDKVRSATEAGLGLYADRPERYTVLLVPAGDEAAFADVRERILDHLPDDLPEHERAGIADWADQAAQADCGSSNQIGGNSLDDHAFLVEVIPVVRTPDCLVPEPEQVAAQVTREWLSDLPRGGATPDDPWHCWAGEAGGWPIQRALLDKAGLRDWASAWAYWNLDLATTPPGQLGLERSTDWTFDREAEQFCFTGVGHRQGSMAHELLIDRHGVERWLQWAETADDGIGATESFGSVFEQDKADFMEEADQRVADTLNATTD